MLLRHPYIFLIQQVVHGLPSAPQKSGQASLTEPVRFHCSLGQAAEVFIGRSHLNTHISQNSPTRDRPAKTGTSQNPSLGSFWKLISPPPGSFSSTAGKQKRPVACVRREELTAALTVRWSALPELLDSAGVSACTGYARSTVSSWVRTGRLRGRIAVAKCDLIAFLVGAGLVIPGGFTKAQKHDLPPV